MSQQQQVKPGDRVVAHGLKGRQDLNGQSAILVGAGGKPGRVRVKFDSGEEVDLKQENLGIGAPPGAGGGGGMPGFGGGMPGMGGGMPGMPAGMPDPAQIQAMVNQAVETVRMTLASVGIPLPASTTPGQLLGGIAVAVAVAMYITTRIFSLTVLMGVGGIAYWGALTDGGRAAIATASSKVSSVVRRPIPTHMMLLVLCMVAAVAGQKLLGGGVPASSGVASTNTAGHASGRNPAIAQAIADAYEQGYEDGVAGADKRPPKHIDLDAGAANFDNGATDDASQQKSGSGFGLSSILKYGMMAYFVFNLGKTPAGGWDPQVAMANAKANPMQAGLMLVMASGIIF